MSENDKQGGLDPEPQWRFNEGGGPSANYDRWLDANFASAETDPGKSPNEARPEILIWPSVFRTAVDEMEKRPAGAETDLPAATEAALLRSAISADVADVFTPLVPPPAGEWLIAVLCKREMREAVLGDLDEKFAELAERRGARVATAWYWSQAARSVLFFGLRWGRRLLELEAILRRIL